jgi:menaquinol-cytochrome c reductase iron-sulfur subunit
MNSDLVEIETAEATPCKASRRRFLSRLTMALGSIAGAIVAIPCVGFLLGLRKVPSAWRTIGKLDDYQIGSTVKVAFLDPSPLPWAGVTARTAAWLRRNSETEFVAFSVDCTHLGCPVRWLPQANLFMCPCHGGVYYANGTVAAGPPPRPLPRYLVRVQGDMVQILTSPVPITT